MTETNPFRVLSCASNRYHNLPSYRIDNAANPKMQSIKPVVRKINTLPRKREAPSKEAYSSSTENSFKRNSLIDKVFKPSELKQPPRREEPPSIFRARSFPSLLDQDDDDADEEEDMFALKLASPVLDEDETYFFPPMPAAKKSTYQPTTILLCWGPDRLTEDELKGFSLGGLILV
jgi:hypothetical protein